MHCSGKGEDFQENKKEAGSGPLSLFLIF